MNRTPYVYRALIVSVYDGDTVRADIDLGFGFWASRRPLRLAGIDAPEIRRPTLQAGRAARDYLRRLVLGKDVLVRTCKPGKYGRWLAEIYLDQRHVNQLMVTAGHAVSKRKDQA